MTINGPVGAGASGEGGAAELLGEVCGMFKGGTMPEGAAPMTVWKNGRRWRGWSKGPATLCLGNRIAVVAEEWGHGRKGRGGERD